MGDPHRPAPYPGSRCAGSPDSRAGAPPIRALLARMAATMENRGPDGEGFWSDDDGRLRLPAAGDHRPARALEPAAAPRAAAPDASTARSTTTASCATSCAGSATRSRPRATPRCSCTPGPQWGEGALDRVNGMFAFAVWDDAERTLTLAADPFGEKPLYYARRRRPARLRLRDQGAPARPGRVRARRTTRRSRSSSRAVRCPRSTGRFFAGVSRLPAAHVLRWRDGETQVRRYWTPAAGRGARAPTTDAVEHAARAAARLDPAAAAQRRAGRHLAERRHRLLHGRRAERAARRRSPPARVHRAASPASRATSGSFAAEVAERAGVVEHHASSRRRTTLARRPAAARRSTTRSPSARSRSTRSGA